MIQNDWIVAGLNNPDFTNKDFSTIADMTVDNTQLLSRDEYLKSDFIKENPLFRNDQGQFSEQKFDEYYNKRVKDFGEFQQEDYTARPALDMFDIDRTPDSEIRDIKFNIGRGVNPDRQAVGIEGVNIWSNPEFSRREIAKQNKVFNTEAGKYEDYSVNDHTLITSPVQWVKDLFKDPLVLATWDEDGEHIDPITGVTREHKKGDAKLNDKGTYFYETLGGRSILGKDVLSISDTLTVDGQGINKYDFFDSNDIKKSVAGTIAKNVAALIPMFIPGVSQVYSAAMVARELSKSLPMLYGMTTALLDTDTPSWMNNLAAIGSRFTTSTSDYAKEHTFAFENFGNLVADVALQWGQQKAIAQAFGKLRGAPNYIEDAQKQAQALYDAKRVTLGDSPELMQACLNKFMPKATELMTQRGQLGRDMSLAYMAIVSNTDVYESMLESGATKAEAAAVALGSTLGMFAVDKYAHLGELFFDDATSDATKAARVALRNEFKQAQNAFSAIKNSDAPARNKILQYVHLAADKSKKVFSQFNEDLKYHTTNLVEKMVGEGLEEVGEELVADASKGLYELAGELGFNTSVKDVGAWDNMFERYAMNFLGGAIGGGVFYGKEVFDGKTFHKPKLDEDIANLIRNGHVDDLRSQLATLRKEGKLGSETLSATDYETTDDGKIVWKTTKDSKNSQAQAIQDLITDRINSIEEVLNANRVNLSDDELFDNMVLTEKRYNRYKNVAQLTNYYQDFATVLNGLINAELNYKRAVTTMDGTKEGAPIPNDTALSHLSDEQKAARDANLSAAKQEITNAKQAVDDFLSGETSLDYVRKLNFAMDPELHAPFLIADLDSYMQAKYPGKTMDDFTPEEYLKIITEEWPEYVQQQLKTKFTEGWERYKHFEQQVNPHLETLGQGAADYKSWLENIKPIFTSDFLNANTYLGWNSKLDSESEDDFKNRNTKQINAATGILETDDEYSQRKAARLAALEQYNDDIDKKIANSLTAELQKVNFQVDDTTARFLRTFLARNGRIRSIILRNVANSGADDAVKALAFQLTPDLSNADQIQDAIIKQAELEQQNAVRNAISDTMNDLLSVDFAVEQDDPEQVDEINHVGNMPDGGYFVGGIEQVVGKTGTILDIQNFLDNFDTEVTPNIKQSEQTDQTAAAAENTANLERVKKALKELQKQGVKAIDFGVQGQDWVPILDDALITSATSARVNSFNSIVSNIKANPLYTLQKQLQVGLVNPLTQLLKQVAQSNGDTLPDIDELLNIIQNDYDTIDDAGQLILNDAQRASLEKAKSYLKLLQPYLAAAASSPSTVNPVGHNKTINEFAAAHADKLRSPWAKLPEVDADYAAMHINTAERYITQIDHWIRLSDENQANKIVKYIDTDKALNTASYEMLKNIPRTITINGKSYDLLEGIDSIDVSALNTVNAQVPLYKLERLLYKNVKAIADDRGISVVDLIENTNLLQTLVPGLEKLDHRRSTSITASLKANEFSDFDKLQYIAAILSEDPAIFYTSQQQRITANPQIAPNAMQELSTRIAVASGTDIFRAIMGKAYGSLNAPETQYLPNTTILFGVAGAGKTQILLNSVDSFIKDKPVIIAAPTAVQAKNMSEAMSRPQSMTFDELLNKLLGKDLWEKVQQDIAKDTKEAYDGDYFSTKLGSDGLLKVTLNPNTLTFNQTMDAPAAIYLDEATHLNTVEAMIIAEYAKQTGAQVYMLGDPLQIGHLNSTSLIANIDEGAVWAVRPPQLSISMRDNNLQKAQNNEIVRDLLAQVRQSRLFDSEQAYFEQFPIAQNIYSKFNFRVFNGDEINGDMITTTLDDDTLKKLKAAADAGKSIAFIGDESSSYLTQLRNAGIDIPKTQILDVAKMQGQEFDITVIDQNFFKPDNISDAYKFLQTLYTLMSRAREASIFIDNGLSNIIGKNVVSPYKSKAPSLLAGIEALRNQKLEILKQLDLTPFDPEKANPKNQPEVKNLEADFEDPDRRSSGADAIAQQVVIGSTAADAMHDSEIDNGIDTITGDISKFPIECYGTVTVLSIEEGPEETRTINGVSVKRNPWKVVLPTDPNEELRNLEALVPDGTEAFLYNEKIELQKKLYRVKSAILYGHTWEEKRDAGILPKEITENFTQSDWEKGTFELEFRAAPYEPTPIYSPFNQHGIKYRDGEDRFVANIIFKVKNRDGRICKFDLAGINDPQTLNDKKAEIVANAQAKINNSKTDAATKKKLTDMVNNIEAASKSYESWFNDKVDKLKQSGAFSIDVSKAITLSKTTWFRKRLDREIRLGGRINPDNISENDVNNLMDRHPDMVFSPVYTYAGQAADFNKLDPSLKGKAVIFVSSDLTLKPDQLIDQYKKQKANPDENEPIVRMIVLNNYAMTFSQMCNRDFIKAVQGKETDIKPFRQAFTGLRMFTSLWNARAALIKFNQAVTKWKADSKYTDVQLDTLLKAQNLQYRKAEITEIEKVLTDAGLTNKDLDNLAKFNNEILLNIPMFRLGYSERENGFHIEYFNIKGSTAYKQGQEKANLCVITPEKALQFQKMLHALIQPICPDSKSALVRSQSLNLELTRKNEKGEKIPWEPDEFIDLSETKHRRTLSGLISMQGNDLIIADSEGNQLAYAEGDYWSAIPMLISKFVSTVTGYQHHMENYDESSSAVSVSFRAPGTGTEKQKIRIPLSDFLSKNGLLNTEGAFDESLLNMCNLIFHGTTDNIHKEVTKDDPLMQLEDAYFKEGFFIDPMRTYVKTSGTHAVAYETADGSAVFFEVSTSPELFTSDVDPQPAGVRLNLQILLTGSVESGTQSTASDTDSDKSAEDKFIKDNPEGAKLIKLLNQQEGQSFNLNDQDLQAAEEYYNSKSDKHEELAWETLSQFGAEAALEVPITFHKDHFVTWKDQLEISTDPNVTRKVEIGENNIVRIKCSDGRIFQSNSKGKTFDLVAGKASDNQQSLSIFNKPYQGGTIESTLNTLLNSAEFKNEIGQSISEEALEQFQKDLDMAIAIGETLTISTAPLEIKIAEMLANEDYSSIFEILGILDQNLLDQLTMNC